MMDVHFGVVVFPLKWEQITQVPNQFWTSLLASLNWEDVVVARGECSESKIQNSGKMELLRLQLTQVQNSNSETNPNQEKVNLAYIQP